MFPDDPFSADVRPRCIVCGRRVIINNHDGTCSPKCSFECKKLQELTRIGDFLNRIEGLLLSALTVAEPQKEVGTNGKQERQEQH